MGVQGLWKILEQTADPVKLDTLRGKTLAIDASIWIYHFLKAMRDPKGTVLVAAHVIGFFRRICKLMFFEIKPVFVFDGAAPLIKKQTTHRRSERRVGREQTARSTANKLLTIQLQRAADTTRNQPTSTQTGPSRETRISGSVPKNAVYFDDLVSGATGSANDTTNPSKSSLPQTPQRQFTATDQYHLPEIDRIGAIRTDDQRLLTEEELEEYGKQFTSQARAGFIDTTLVDFKSKEFELLPVETQYQLLNMARMKSRLRMGYTTEQLNEMFPDEMEFSKFQINRVAQRNFFTQKLINLMGMEEDLTRRVSSEKNKEYILKKNDQGWSLSLGDDFEDQKKPPNQPSPGSSGLNARMISASSAPPNISSDSDVEFEEVDLSAQGSNDKNYDLAPDRSPVTDKPGQTTSLQQSHQSDVREKENALAVNKLFGFEAELSRNDLYDRLAFNMESEDEDEDLSNVLVAQTANKLSNGGGARSMLFGKSVKDRTQSFGTTTENRESTDKIKSRARKYTKYTKVPSHSYPQFFEKPNLHQNTSKKLDPKPAAPAVPWFKEQGSFQDMQIQEQELENFVPLDYVSDNEPEADESTVTPVQDSDSNIIGHRASSTESPKEVLIDGEQESRSEFNSRPATAVSPDLNFGSIIIKRTHGKNHILPQADSTLTSMNLHLGEGQKQQPQSEMLCHFPSHQKPASPSENAFRPRTISEEASQSPMADSPSKNDDLVVELSPEEATRAEEDAKANKEEEEDIAGMLIAEAEENERFAKELAHQTNQDWSQANERDYQAQISQLRGQFAKASRDADSVTAEMIQECQELLQLFGIPYVTAPGEAEAQCATLHSLKLVDGVVTDDGDTFLFDDDAKVYRNMFSQAKFVEFYSTKRIHSRLGLDRRSMIDLAFLLGSDYTDGILGIGPVTGVEILAEFGNLSAFAKWWSETQRFTDQAEIDTSLKRRLVKNFKTKLYLPDEFPDPVVVNAYTHPAVDKNSEKFSWGTPDLDGLRHFMETTAGWDAEKTDSTLLPVVQESRRRELLDKTEKVMNQSRLEDYYQTVVQNPALGSKRATRAAGLMRKRQKK